MIFHTVNYVTLNNLSLKYLGFMLSGCKGIGIRNFDFMAKNQFLFTIRFALFLDKMIKSTEKNYYLLSGFFAVRKRKYNF